MSTTPITTVSSSATNVQKLVDELVNRVDSNKDGQITTDEFGAFLKTMLSGLGAGQEGSAISPLSLEGAGESSDAVEAAPSTWSDNNAPYGVTFAGFSPQDHRDLTLADLGVPGKAEKYAAYSYLLTNKVQPTSDWAPGVAEALNRKYNTSVFHAIDGETLGYGNEYIHSAANGYGMAPGTYNRNATGEFFWGWV
jgi:hypothetical protein